MVDDGGFSVSPSVSSTGVWTSARRPSSYSSSLAQSRSSLALLLRFDVDPEGEEDWTMDGHMIVLSASMTRASPGVAGNRETQASVRNLWQCKAERGYGGNRGAYVRACSGGGGNSPKESSSESRALARLWLSPSMNSNPCEETNSSTSWSSFEEAVAVVTAELSLSVENRMASLISGSSELISPLNFSTCSLYDYSIKESRNRSI